MKSRKFFALPTLFFIIVVLLLTLGFYRNQWKAAGKKWFYDWRANFDTWVVARLTWSRQAGTFADAALLGLGDTEWPIQPEMQLHQYETYLSNGNFVTYWTYNSMIGGQGVIFSLIDQFSNYKPAVNLKIFRGITSALSAIALGLIIVWVASEFNYLSAILVFGYCLLSEWLALFGSSLYFQLWAYYIPVIGITFFFHNAKDQDNISARHIISITTLAVFIKVVFNGFEFVTTALAMMFVPIVYYSISRKWEIKTFVVRSFHASIGAVTGILLSVVLLSFQLFTVTGSWGRAFQYLAFTFGKRAAGDPTEYTGIIAESLRASVWSVLWKYLSAGRAVNLGNWITSDSAWLRGYFEIQYHQIFLLFILFGLMYVFFPKRDKTSRRYQKTLALLYTTIFSFLPPLSWLVIFKAHSYIHTHQNYILWEMPFTLLGFAFCGMVINYLFSFQRNNSQIGTLHV
jgi:hypothetical protein